MKYVCTVCGWEYDEEKGAPEHSLISSSRSALNPPVIIEETPAQIKSLPNTSEFAWPLHSKPITESFCLMRFTYIMIMR